MAFSQNDIQKMENTQIEFVHIRHATSIIKIGNKKILIDPMLSKKDSLPTINTSDNKLKNPRIDLPFNSDSIIKNIDYVLLTHLHFDHFDKKAIEILPKSTHILCSKTDSKNNNIGFSSTIPIENEYEIDDIKITQFPAIHGKGLLKYMMGKGSSYLITYKGFKIFLTGDCIWSKSLKNNLLTIKPDIIIANAGAAKLKIGKPITMSINDIQEISKHLNETKIYVVHLDALNHCSETSDYCKEQTLNNSNIIIPNCGEIIELD